jgi:hypothetical protein
MPHTGCELCLPSWKKNATYGECDLLKVYGSVCGEMPGATLLLSVELQLVLLMLVAVATAKKCLYVTGAHGWLGNLIAAVSYGPAKCLSLALHSLNDNTIAITPAAAAAIAAAADMPECREWDSMCTADPTLFACSTHSATPKPMAMDGKSAAAGNATAADAAPARSGSMSAVLQLGLVLMLSVLAVLVAV